jgi:hypothetical protein
MIQSGELNEPVSSRYYLPAARLREILEMIGGIVSAPLRAARQTKGVR